MKHMTMFVHKVSKEILLENLSSWSRDDVVAKLRAVKKNNVTY